MPPKEDKRIRVPSSDSKTKYTYAIYNQKRYQQEYVPKAEKIEDLFSMIRTNSTPIGQRIRAVREYIKQAIKKPGSEYTKIDSSVGLFVVNICNKIKNIKNFDDWQAILNDALDMHRALHCREDFLQAIRHCLESGKLIIPDPSDFFPYISSKIEKYKKDKNYLLSLLISGLTKYLEKSDTQSSLQKLERALDQMVIQQADKRKGKELIQSKKKPKSQKQSVSINDPNDPIFTGKNQYKGVIGPSWNPFIGFRWWN